MGLGLELPEGVELRHVAYVVFLEQARDRVLGERGDAGEGMLDGHGPIGDDVLDGDLVGTGVEATEQVEGVAGHVGGEQEDGTGLVRGDGGADLHGGPRVADREGLGRSERSAVRVPLFCG